MDSASAGLHPDFSRTYGFADGVVGSAPASSVEPFGNFTLTMRPIGAPFLTASSTTVTSSPALNALLDQPRCVIPTGFCVSSDQLRTSPVSSFASIFRKQCGLAQIHSVTVPASVTFLDVSKLALP